MDLSHLGVDNQHLRDIRRALDFPAVAERARSNATNTALVGTRCDHCGTASWPSRALCRMCGSAAVRQEEFASGGVLLTYTTVHVSRPGLSTPYVLGQVRLNEHGPVVFGHVHGLAEPVELPLPVTLGCDAAAVPWYWFDMAEA
jgi:uncharacterized protein